MVNVRIINFTDIARDRSLRLSWAFAGQPQRKHTGISYPLDFFLSKEKYLLGKIDLYEAESNGRFPLIDQSVSDIAGYTDDEELVYQGPLPVIIFGDHTRIFKYVDFPFVQGADGIKVLLPDNSKVLPKFFYYLLKNVGVPSRGYNRHFTILRNQKYPLFPIDQQKSILNVIEEIEKQIKQLKSKFRKPRDIIDEIFAEEFNFDVEVYNKVKLKKIFSIPFKFFSASHLLRSTVIFQQPSSWYIRNFLAKKTKSLSLKKILKEKIHRGKQPEYSESKEIKVVKTLNISKDGMVNFDETQFVTKQFFLRNQKARIKKFDLLLSSTGMGRGKFALYNRDEPVFADSHISIIRFDTTRFNPFYMLYFCQSIPKQISFAKLTGR